MAQPRLGVGQPGALVGRRAPADLASSFQASTLTDSSPQQVLKMVPSKPAQVTEVEHDERVQRALPGTSARACQLDPARAVREVQERGLALAAADGEAARRRGPAPRSPRRVRVLMRRLRLGDQRHAAWASGSGSTRPPRQCLELRRDGWRAGSEARSASTSSALSISVTVARAACRKRASPRRRHPSSAHQRLADQRLVGEPVRSGPASVEPTDRVRRAPCPCRP